jgi:hypothetical protein
MTVSVRLTVLPLVALQLALVALAAEHIENLRPRETAAATL